MSLLWKTATAQPDYITHHELAQMYSGDFDVPMTQALHELRKSYQDGVHGGYGVEGVHPADYAHGGPDNYIRHLKKDIAQNGIKTPLTIRNGNVLEHGHHRGIAAMQLKMDRIPVEHIR